MTRARLCTICTNAGTPSSDPDNAGVLAQSLSLDQYYAVTMDFHPSTKVLLVGGASRKDASGANIASAGPSTLFCFNRDDENAVWSEASTPLWSSSADGLCGLFLGRPAD